MHGFVYIHGVHRGNIEAGKPHINNDGDFHGIVVILELTS